MSKKMIFSSVAVIVLLICALSSCKMLPDSDPSVSVWSPEDITEGDTVGNDSGLVSEGRLYFGGTRDKALFWGEDGAIMWLYAENEGIFDGFDTGDSVRVSHGPIMLSYPGQTSISEIALLENGDESSFTDEEKSLLERVSDGFR